MSECQKCGITGVLLVPDVTTRKKTYNGIGGHTGYRVQLVCSECNSPTAEAHFTKDQWICLMLATGGEDILPKKWLDEFIQERKF